jgi:hypothetical protein
MSHFSVIVVLDEQPTAENLEAILAPYHEFECTGVDNEYVVDVDRTEEALAEFAKATVMRLRDPEGNLHDRFDEEGEWKPEFSKPGDYGRREGFIPEGYVEVEILASEHESFTEWAKGWYGWSVASWERLDLKGEHKYGYILLDAEGKVGRCVDRTNPNKKWDWWVIGGRYSGLLAAGLDPESGPKDGGNTARWGAIDLTKLKVAKVDGRRKMVNEIVEKSGLSFEDFEAGYAAYDAAHLVWLELSEPRPRGAEFTEWVRTQPGGELAASYLNGDTWRSIETDKGQTISEWIEATPPLSSYAAIVDGKWCSRGDVGWWGISSNETDEWPSQFQAILDSIRPDQYVAYVDCHI